MPTNRIYLVIDLSFEFPIPRMKKARLFANKKSISCTFNEYAGIFIEFKIFQEIQ